ncbi:phosphopantothenate--cysteine ligase [Enterococcus sp. LJL98]
MKRILITAGGTAERIDRVRSITNHSTGQLGCLIAESFLAQGVQVDYLTTKTATRPKEQTGLHVFFIHDTRELEQTLTKCLQATPYDAVIHSMAVSDFTPASSFSIKDFTNQLNQLLTATAGSLTEKDLAQLIETSAQEPTTKISSNTDYLFLALKKTTKVIQKIKEIQPKTQLVSFKLLVDVPKEELFQVAFDSLTKNQGDFVLANDLISIQSGKHTGYLLDHTGAFIGEAHTKAAIAQLITETLTQGKDD